MVKDAEFVFIAYGIVARICYSAAQALRKQGIKAGLLRPKTLFPFPKAPIEALARRKIPLGVVELSSGQMADDVDLTVKGAVPVYRYLTMGGETPTVGELIEAVKHDLAQRKKGGLYA